MTCVLTLCRLATSCSQALRQVAVHTVLIVVTVVAVEGEVEAVMVQAISGIGPTRCFANAIVC